MIICIKNMYQFCFEKEMKIKIPNLLKKIKIGLRLFRS